MKTLGIDLASDPKKTGVCVVAWGDSEAVVEELRVGADDEELLAAHDQVDVTGIDAPFGWPVPFEKMLRGESPRWVGPWAPERRDPLRFRVTDFRVRELTGRWPLSVSTDLIGVPALRCAGLLERMGVIDRSGDGQVFEVYPAAALNSWGLRSTGYKGRKGRSRLAELWISFERQIPWICFAAEDQVALLKKSDDAFDALVAAIVTRAAKNGLTFQPTEEEQPRAMTEGWIHVPVEGSLDRLV
jgi:predicted nuclease with RNAse H fold